ncbi:MAG: glycosyltransferase family A protein [Clostridiales bacterium]|nr:glycosyltransferase family A protein [Clostridiales bacterium]
MITILTPTYNRAYRLERLHESLLKQTSRDFEWIIIDDGSNDKTKKFIPEDIVWNAIARRIVSGK